MTKAGSARGRLFFMNSIRMNQMIQFTNRRDRVSVSLNLSYGILDAFCLD